MPSWRLSLALFGLALALLALAALAYAWAPVNKVREQVTPAATFFVPPLTTGEGTP